jgi:hypothetical protein
MNGGSAKLRVAVLLEREGCHFSKSLMRTFIKPDARIITIPNVQLSFPITDRRRKKQKHCRNENFFYIFLKIFLRGKFGPRGSLPSVS